MNKDESFSSLSMSKKKERLMDLLAMRIKMKGEKSREKSKLNEGHDSQKPVNKCLKRKKLNGHKYKKFFKIAGLKAKLRQEGDHVVEVDGSDLDDKRGFKSSCLGSKSKRQRVGLDSGGVCLVNAESAYKSCGISSMDGGQCETAVKVDQCAEGARGLQSQLESQCAICMIGGDLLLCCGQGCRKSFHISCLDPPLPYASLGHWHCFSCTKKKIEHGVVSVSKGIESILDARDMVLDDAALPKQKEYLVKYKSLAHVHNQWLPETQLLLEAPSLLSRFKKYFRTKWKAEWSVPHRLLKRRQLTFHGDGLFDCQFEWLVKWTGLNYDHATWELETSSFLKTREAMTLITNFETRGQKYAFLQPLKEFGRVELSEFQFEVSRGLCDSVLPYVNKLHDRWHRGQNAVFFDGQERLMKVVFFVLSLLDKARDPILILAASSALSIWEAEFSKWSKLADVITYTGNKDVRATIRALEFYNEDGCISFQVLLSSPDVIVEDLEMLEHIKWEAIIIDECQRPRISMHYKKIKMLATDMKLLIFTGEILDVRQSYHNTFSLLESNYEDKEKDKDMEINIRTFRERLSPFIAFECNFSASKYEEYWVPVHLSHMQIEQYCSLLLSNSEVLSSCLKDKSSLHDILTLTQKCCDHPYFVNPTLRNSSARDFSVDQLGSEINVSGKLHLLDKVLSEIKRRGLRVLVLFQSVVGSEKISIGDVLDDLVHKRFGQDSYIRIQGKILSEYARSNRKEALNSFNNIDTGRFICLLDYRSCHPSIRLSCMDVAILFNGDWNPLTDLKALQKITIDSGCKQLKVFRLYSSFSIEENTLILAKQGKTVDGNIHNINWRVCQLLLTWGASYLFKKLQSYIESDVESSKRFFVDDLVHELSSVMLNDSRHTDSFNGSIMSKAQMNDGAYMSNIFLLGEKEAHTNEFSIEKQLIEHEPHIFWTNLLKESHHGRDRVSNRLSRRVQRPLRDPCYSFEGYESENDVNSSAKVNIDKTSSSFVITKKRSKRKACAKTKRRYLPWEFPRFDYVSTPRVPENVTSVCRGAEGSSRENVVEIEQQSESCSQINEKMLNNNGGGDMAQSIHPTTCISIPRIPESVKSECRGRDETSSIENVTEIKEQSEGFTQINEEMLNNNGGGMAQSQVGTGQGMSPTPDQGEFKRGSLLENGMEPFTQTLKQATEQLPIRPNTCVSDTVALNRISTDNVQECQNNLPQISPMRPSVSQSCSINPLESEIENIQKDMEQVTNIHQEKEPLNHFLMQPTAQFPLEATSCAPMVDFNSVTSIIRSTNGILECQSNQPLQTLTFSPSVFQSSSIDPLEIEIERIQKDREQAIKMHQEKILMLHSEREKEMLAIHKKYNALMQESDMGLEKQREGLERDYSLVYANKVLAEILAQNYDDLKEAQPEKTERVTSAMNILRAPTPMPAPIIPPANPYFFGLPTPHFSNHTSFETVLRAPAPHLMSTPRPFTSFHDLPSFLHSTLTTPEPFYLETPPNTTQVLLQPELNHRTYPQVNMGFGNFLDTGFHGMSFGSNYRAF